jgi:hypothetical protein
MARINERVQRALAHPLTYWSEPHCLFAAQRNDQASFRPATICGDLLAIWSIWAVDARVFDIFAKARSGICRTDFLPVPKDDRPSDVPSVRIQEIDFEQN